MVYLDTSALIKRYVPELNSDRFETFFAAQEDFLISRLTYVELRSTLSRKRRERRLSEEQERAALNEIRTDILDGALVVQPMSDADFSRAFHLIDSLPDVPLRSLDALHLAVAQDRQADALATADDVMRRAALALGLQVAYFGDTH